MGGSLGGLTAALVLRDAGCDVVVYERSRVPLEGRGAGIVLHPATVRYLVERRVCELPELSAPARFVRYLLRDASVADERPCRLRFTSYHALHRELLRGVEPGRYRLGREVTGFAQDADGVEVELADGARDRCDLLVCADGIHSTGRQLLLPGHELVYAGYVGWRGTVDEADLTAETFAALEEAILYHVLPSSHVLVYPIPNVDGSVEPGRRLTNFVWYRNVQAGAPLEDLLTDTAGATHTVSLAPGAVREPHVRELREAAARDLPAPIAEVVARTAEPFVQAVFDLEVPRMAFGRACLIGDAAFVLRPHVAAGTAKAADDAWALGEAVRAAGGDPVEALRRWEPERLEVGRRAFLRTREAGDRSQFLSSWSVGDPLPFGLREDGDSALA